MLRKIFLIITLTLSIQSKSFIQQKDKQLHIAASFLIATTIKNAYLNSGYSYKDATFYSFSGTMLLGLGKEILDEFDYGGFSIKDLGADLIGTSLAEIVNIRISF